MGIYHHTMSDLHISLHTATPSTPKHSALQNEANDRSVYSEITNINVQRDSPNSMIMTIIVPPNICQASWRNVNAMVKKSEPTKPQAPTTVPIARIEVLQVFMSNAKIVRESLQ